MGHRRKKEGRKFPLATRHRYVAWAGVVACSGFLVTGILLLVGGIREWQIESASVNWPTTQAEITRSEVVKAFQIRVKWWVLASDRFPVWALRQRSRGGGQLLR